MGQSDIISFLRKKPNEWFNANEISHKLEISIGSVLACLRRLRKSELIDFKSQLTKVGTVYKKIFVYSAKKKMIVDIFFFVIACMTLVWSSTYLIKAITRISINIGLNEFTVGFIIIAISTSLPDLFVGITSALGADPALSLGSVIGSNIIDLTLIVGIAALLVRGIKIKSKIIKKDVTYMLAILLVPVILMWDSVLGRIDGVILLAIFGFYIFQMLRQERKFRKKLRISNHKEVAFYTVLTICMALMLLISSSFLVEFASRISTSLNLSPLIFGIFIVAFGTTLPELFTSTKAVLERHEELALGDLLGSVITNSTLVLGVTALVNPIHAEFVVFFTGALFMIITAFIFMTFAESDRGISWKEGASLIFLYIFFVLVETTIKMLSV